VLNLGAFLLISNWYTYKKAVGTLRWSLLDLHYDCQTAVKLVASLV
jgi:hypothetical protein